MWGILTTTQKSLEFEEVTIDSAANWKPPKNMMSIKSEEESNDCKRMTKAMSPGSMNMPTMNNWDMNQAMSPYMTPDMNSIASGSMMNNPSTPTNYPNSVNHRNSSATSNYEMNCGTTTTSTPSAGSGSNDYVNGTAGPISHLNDTVNSLDPLNAMEKAIHDQVRELKKYLPDVSHAELFELVLSEKSGNLNSLLLIVYRCHIPHILHTLLIRRTRRAVATADLRAYHHLHKSLLVITIIPAIRVQISITTVPIYRRT